MSYWCSSAPQRVNKPVWMLFCAGVAVVCGSVSLLKVTNSGSPQLPVSPAPRRHPPPSPGTPRYHTPLTSSSSARAGTFWERNTP